MDNHWTSSHVNPYANKTLIPTIHCRPPVLVMSHGLTSDENVFQDGLSLFILQLCWVTLISRALGLLLKPLKQPRFVTELLSGIIAGPFVLGRLKPNVGREIVTNLEGLNMLATFANIGIMYWVFLAGSEVDLMDLIKKMKRNMAVFAVSSFVCPVLMAGVTFTLISWPDVKPWSDEGRSYIFLGGILISFTSFTTLVPVLAEFKLLYTNVGKIALSSTLMKDVCSFLILAANSTVSVAHAKIKLAPLYVVLLAITFLGVLVFIIRPRVLRLVRAWEEGDGIEEVHITLILMGVLVCGTITDSFGLHPCFGTFFFGLMMPNGRFSMALSKKLEDFAIGLFLPLFYGLVGLQMNFDSLNSKGAIVLGLVCFGATVGKALGTYVIARFYGIHWKDSLVLALLLDMRGVVELLYLSAVVHDGVISQGQYTVIALGSLLTVMIICPSISILTRKDTQAVPYRHRSVEREQRSSTLRILSCIHSPQSVSSFISLLEASSYARQTPIHINVLHLVALPDSNIALTQAASVMIIHDSQVGIDNYTRSVKGSHQMTSTNDALGMDDVLGHAVREHNNDNVAAMFDGFHEETRIPVQTITTMSPYKSMHKDVCSLATEKRIALIIMPFHKQKNVMFSTVDRNSSNTAFRDVNTNVLQNAPCSVAIFIDRGLEPTFQNVAVLFFGGPDDREALYFADHMAEHERLNLTIVRFIQAKHHEEDEDFDDMGEDDEEEEDDLLEREKKEEEKDQRFLRAMRLRTNGDLSRRYEEVKVRSGEETVSIINSMAEKYDLFVFGRSLEMWESKVMAGMAEWSEFRELGPLGDIFASSDFSASALVVQQYRSRTGQEGELEERKEKKKKRRGTTLMQEKRRRGDYSKMNPVSPAKGFQERRR